MPAHNEADIIMVEIDAEVLPSIDLYGIDPEGPVPLEDHGTVEVNDIQNPFSPYVFSGAQIRNQSLEGVSDLWNRHLCRCY